MTAAVGKNIEFVPYALTRRLTLGDSKRVAMSSRSPSPVGQRYASSDVSSALPASGSGALRASSSGSTPVRANVNTSTQASASVSASGVSASALASASTPARGVTPASPRSPGTPSRKGKERERERDAMANGKKPSPASANGSVNTPNGSANGTPKPKPKPKANGIQAPNGVATSSAITPAAPPPSPPVRGLSAATVDLSWPEPFASAKRAAGLFNGSMACYTNATLQVLMHTPPVLRVALAHAPDDCLLASRGKFCMLCALRKIATVEHWAGKKRAYRPMAVHNYLGQIKKGFSKNRQEDTHEFFRFVTDALQNTALAGKPKDLPEKLKRTTWVYRTWGGQVRSRVLCLSCRKPSDTFDSFLDLSLDVSPKARSLGDLFAGFVREDKLDGDNKYHCENCKKKSAATKSMRIAEAPPVLTLHLKRFGYSLSWPGRMTKMNNLVEYPQILDISPYMIEGAESEKYRLFGVTCHHGSSLHYGHYTSYVRGPDGTWFNADDESVDPMRPAEALHDRAAYLLSYMRIGKGDKTPVSTPKSSASSQTSPIANGKRRRDDSNDSPSPQRTKLPARAPLAQVMAGKAAYAANGVATQSTAKANGLHQLNNYNSDTSSDATPGPQAPLAAPVPRHADSEVDAPIQRPSHPSPGAAQGLKGKHHRNNHKAAAMGNAKFHSHAGQKRHGAPMPFSAGNMRSNARYDVSRREVNIRKKGMRGRMRGKGK